MQAIDKVLKVLADKNRLRILNLLTKKQMCVCELSFVLGVSQPSISRHLKKLTDAGLVSSKKNGYWTDCFLSVEDEGLKKLVNLTVDLMSEDAFIQKDLKRAEKANRNNLCS